MYVLVARNSANFSLYRASSTGRLTKEHLDKAIGHKLSNDYILCTVDWWASKVYVGGKGIKIYQYKSEGKIRKQSLYHIQNVNSYKGSINAGYSVLTV